MPAHMFLVAGGGVGRKPLRSGIHSSAKCPVVIDGFQLRAHFGQGSAILTRVAYFPLVESVMTDVKRTRLSSAPVAVECVT